MSLKDLKPMVISEIFTKEQYEDIYQRVNNTFPSELTAEPVNKGYMNAGEIGYFAYVNGFRQDVYDCIRELGELHTGYKLESPMIHFARYSLKTGYPPILKPHYDEMLKYPSLTLSIQMDKTFDWDLYANFDSASLNCNEAMLFSGSHQIHWRPRVEFNDNDYYDIMVCQMTIVGSEELSKEHFEDMFRIKYDVLKEYFKLYPENVNSLPKEKNISNV